MRIDWLKAILSPKQYRRQNQLFYTLPREFKTQDDLVNFINSGQFSSYVGKLIPTAIAPQAHDTIRAALKQTGIKRGDRSTQAAMARKLENHGHPKQS